MSLGGTCATAGNAMLMHRCGRDRTRAPAPRSSPPPNQQSFQRFYGGARAVRNCREPRFRPAVPYSTQAILRRGLKCCCINAARGRRARPRFVPYRQTGRRRSLASARRPRHSRRVDRDVLGLPLRRSGSSTARPILSPVSARIRSSAPVIVGPSSASTMSPPATARPGRRGCRLDLGHHHRAVLGEPAACRSRRGIAVCAPRRR